MDLDKGILIVEDETPIAEVLSYALSSEGYNVQHSMHGGEALQLLRNNHFALAILDVGLPDMSGFDLCRELRSFSDIPILFLTSRCDEIDRIIGLEIGADDYVSKPFSPREVAARVRVILRRRMSGSGKREHHWFEQNSETERISFCNNQLDLTRYEQLLLQQLLQHPGRIYERTLLMDLIWRDALDTSDRTVDTHIKTLRAKLKHIRQDIEPIITHRGMGYSLINGTDA